MLIARRKRSAIAPLLRADEEDLVAVLLAGVADELVFFQRERQRLLAEDVLAGLQRFDGDLHVPMVGRHDADHVNVAALQHLAIVAVDVGLALADVRIVLRLLRMLRVDIAHGHDVAKPGVVPGITLPHAARADAADARPIVGRLLANARRCQLK